MTRPAGNDADNVVPLRRSHGLAHGQAHAPIREMADAARAFGLLERCAAAVHYGPLDIAGAIDGIECPIVSLQAQLPVTQRWLDHLGRINITTWPDTRWVLRLGEARAAATRRLQAVARSLYRSPPGTGPLDSRLAADIGRLADALHALCELIAQQYPEALRAP